MSLSIGRAVLLIVFFTAARAFGDTPPAAIAGIASSPSATVNSSPSAAQDTSPSTASRDIPIARRPRWGGDVGIRRFGGTAVWDYTNSATPLASYHGPFPGAVITFDHTWTGKYFSGGYRGPFRSDSKVGFGVEMQLSGMGDDLSELHVDARNVNGFSMRFETERAIIDLITVSGSAHVSYNVASALNVLAGAKYSALRIKVDPGFYRQSFPPFTQFYLTPGDSPDFSISTVVPWVGAEYLLSHHLGLDVVAEFLPTRASQLTDMPLVLTFARHRSSMTAALRVFF